MVAADGGRTGPLEVPPDAQLERLQRRVAALERQLDARIAQVDDLRERLAEQERVAAVATQEAAVARQQADHWAAEHQALMNTVTMRTLRRPRAWYASARRRLARP